MRKDERGYIVVETVLSFMLFVFLTVSILTLINIFTVRSRVHYAITQTANELSMYSYIIDVSGDTTDFLENLDSVIDAIGNLSVTAGGVQRDPREALYALVLYGMDRTNSGAMQMAVHNTVSKHLPVGGLDADAYLRHYNVIEGINGIDFSDSVFINSDGDIVIVARYSIDYAFGLGWLPLPEDMRTLTVSQTAKTKAWLGGTP